jgi:CheY-like chemotaxis protein
MAATAIFQGGPDPAEGPLRVLALEDDPDTARFVGHVLRAAGMDVRLVGTVAEALRLAEAGGFDLALADVELPDGDGVEFAGRLSALDPPIPVVLTSAHGIDIAAHVEDKLRLIACYRSQTAVRDYLEDDTVRAVARYWSRYSDAAHAEPIDIIRQQAAVGAAAPARPAGVPVWTEPVDA